MALIRSGDRGAIVSQLQTSLNSLPSRLSRLTADGIFGPRTLARVIEFQKDNGLKPDGIVGDATSAKIKAAAQKGDPDAGLTPQNFANSIAASLSSRERMTFFGIVQPRIIANPLILTAPVVEAILLLIILALFATILINSQSKASQQAGRDLQRQIDRLMEKLKSDPSTAGEVANEALATAKADGRKLEKRTRDELKKCFDKFTPAQLAKKLLDCKELVKSVETLLESLITILGRPVGGGGTGFFPQDIIRGISRVSGELINALRLLGTCTGCDNLFF